MSTLQLVRHGQASFFEDDYDRLSPIGRQQAQRLAEYWLARGIAFDEVYCGPRARHRDTAAIVARAFAEAGQAFPDPIEHAGFDEYAAEAVLKAALPRMGRESPEIAALEEALAASGSRAETLRNFQKLYEVVILRWARGDLPLAEVEAWPQFHRRVLAALAEVTSGRANRRAVVFTSGGPIGVAVHRALETSLERTLQLAWMVRNGAFCEFLFSGERFTLSSYNAFPHLDHQNELLTYR